MGFCAVLVRHRGMVFVALAEVFYVRTDTDMYKDLIPYVCEAAIQTTHIIYIFVCWWRYTRICFFFEQCAQPTDFCMQTEWKLCTCDFIRYGGSGGGSVLRSARVIQANDVCRLFYICILVGTYIYLCIVYVHCTYITRNSNWLCARCLSRANSLFVYLYIYNTSFCVELFPFLWFRWVCYTHSLLLTLHSGMCAVNRANGFFVYRSRSRARASSCRLVLRFKSAIIWLRFMWIWCRFMGARIARIGFFFFSIAPTYIFIGMCTLNISFIYKGTSLYIWIG